MQINQGQRIKLADLFGATGAPRFEVELAASGGGLTVDFACFGLDAAGRLSDDRYMTFFNQAATPCGGVALTATRPGATDLRFELGRLPASIERLVLTAAIDGPGVMRQLGAGHVRLQDGGREVARFAFSGTDFQDERALMLAEIYRKDGAWRVLAVGQGFNGGLDALVKHFGASVAEEAAPGTAGAGAGSGAGAGAGAAQQAARVNLDKRIAAEAPQLVSLVKKATVSLEKAGLGQHRAKVCLCIDISASMGGLYERGLVQAFAERVLALACRFDDDGEIDVFLFGAWVHHPEPMNLSNCSGYVGKAIKRHPLEGGTNYGAAMQAIRAFYFPQNAQQPSRGAAPQPTAGDVPVYVMFLTDGSTGDKPLTETQLIASSYEPMFWQFIGIGKKKDPKAGFFASLVASDFSFLEKLDELPGRYLDNADFFSVATPDEHPDEVLFDMLMTEYPGWIKLAKQKGLLR